MLHHMLEHIFRLMNLFVVHLFNLCVMLEFESKEKEKKISKANGKQIEKGKQNQPNSPSSSSQPNSAWWPRSRASSRAAHSRAWPNVAPSPWTAGVVGLACATSPRPACRPSSAPSAAHSA
jgi:hypothetical protein